MKRFIFIFILIICSSKSIADSSHFVFLGYAGFERNDAGDKQYKGYGLQVGAGTFFYQIMKYLSLGSEVNLSHYYGQHIAPSNEPNIKLNTYQASMILGTYSIRARGGVQYLDYSNSSFKSELVGTFGVTLDLVKTFYVLLRLDKKLSERMDKLDRFTLLVNSDFVGKGGDHSVDSQWSVVLNYNF